MGSTLMPMLPRTFRSARLVVNGETYDLSNVVITDESTEVNRDVVMGAGGVRGFTRGTTTMRVVLEAELAPSREFDARDATIASAFSATSGLNPERRVEPKVTPLAEPKSVWDRLLADE